MVKRGRDVKLTIFRFAPENLDKSNGNEDYAHTIDELFAQDSARIAFLISCLEKLGLKVNTGSTSIPSLSRLYLTSNKPQALQQLIDNIQTILISEPDSETKLIMGENDTFVLEVMPGRETQINGAASRLVEQTQSLDGIIDYNKIRKHVLLYTEGFPIARETPYFNHQIYYKALERYRFQAGFENQTMGSPFMYGEVVTSTNTMLDKY